MMNKPTADDIEKLTKAMNDNQRPSTSGFVCNEATMIGLLKHIGCSDSQIVEYMETQVTRLSEDDLP